MRMGIALVDKIAHKNPHKSPGYSNSSLGFYMLRRQAGPT